MRIKAVTPILNVSDVPASLDWFERVGWVRAFTWNDAGMIAAAASSNQHGPAQFAGLCAQSPTSQSAEEAKDDHADRMLFLCRGGQGSRDPRPCTDPDSDQYGGTWMTWWVDDVDACHAECIKNAIEVVRPPVTEPWGVRECLIRHPDGHYFRISGHVR